ncbi:MAG: prepilin-type N-terminal cleavage/methylation domain-containing protein, partial [Cyanobacteria bacterium J06649_11]
MLLCHVRKQDRGFTLIEMMVVTVIAGIIGALAIPSFFGLFNRNRGDQAIAEIEGALKEAQKRATRNSRSCTINIDTTGNSISNNAGDNCLLTTRNINDDFTINSNTTDITFSGKGNIGGVTPVIVVSFPDGGSNQQRCVVVQSPLG